jgi:hypothetical protein
MARYYWWTGKDLMTNGFLPMILAEGADNLRVEFHPDSKELVIKNAAGEVCGTYNETQTCPPRCD